ncbi:MAG: hypothetical protein J6T73_02605, partial [Clostridia bacterium]|nr:hypothetical protein [Clostridia bacterium]
MKKLLGKFLICALSVTLFVSPFNQAVCADGENEVADSAAVSAVSDTAGDYELYCESFDYPMASEDIEVEIGKTFENDVLEFSVEVPADAFYAFGLHYKALGTKTNDLVFGLKIDGEYPFSDAKKLNLFRIYTNQEGGNRVDGLGNEFAPKQIAYDGFYFDNVYDITKWTNEDYLFALSAGVHTVSLVPGDGSFEIKSAKFSAVPELKNYDGSNAGGENYKGDPVIIEGESAIIKTSKSLAGLADNSTLDVSPMDAYNILVNYIGGSNWNTSGQTLVWETGEVKAG